MTSEVVKSANFQTSKICQILSFLAENMSNCELKFRTLVECIIVYVQDYFSAVFEILKYDFNFSKKTDTMEPKLHLHFPHVLTVSYYHYNY